MRDRFLVELLIHFLFLSESTIVTEGGCSIVSCEWTVGGMRAVSVVPA